MKCPKCGYNKYQVPEGEMTRSTHPCPNCGEDGLKNYKVSVTFEFDIRATNEREAELEAIDIVFNAILESGKYKCTINPKEELELN